MTSSLRAHGVAASCALALSIVAGCGDGPICQTEALVVIQSPRGPVVADSVDKGTGLDALLSRLGEQTGLNDSRAYLAVKDDLQKVMTRLRELDETVPLQFQNYR